MKIVQDYLIIISECFASPTPPRFYLISAIGFLKLFESGSIFGEFLLDDLLSDVNEVKVLAPLYYTTISRPRGLHVRNELLTAFSISCTHWKRERDRYIYIRVLTSGQSTAQVITVRLPMTAPGQRAPLQPKLRVFESPKVKTDGSVPGLVTISSWEKCVSQSGRLYLVNRDPERTYYSSWLEQPSDNYLRSSRRIWFSSLWAFSDQKNYDWLEGGNSISLKDECHRIPLPSPDDSRFIAIDYQSGVVHFSASVVNNAVAGDITIWYPS